MPSDLLPGSVTEIVKFLAMMARGYDNHLKWNEQDMFKADLMNVRPRWRSVDVAAFQRACRDEGMRAEDITLLVDWLKKAQSGRRLVPSKTYRTSHFRLPSDEELAAWAPEYPPLNTSRAW